MHYKARSFPELLLILAQKMTKRMSLSTSVIIDSIPFQSNFIFILLLFYFNLVLLKRNKLFKKKRKVDKNSELKIIILLIIQPLNDWTIKMKKNNDTKSNKNFLFSLICRNGILNRFAGNFGSLLKVKLGADIQSTVLDDLISLHHVCSLKSNNQRHLQVNSLAGIHNTLSNCGTINNSTKYVNKNTLYLVETEHKLW